MKHVWIAERTEAKVYHTDPECGWLNSDNPVNPSEIEDFENWRECRGCAGELETTGSDGRRGLAKVLDHMDPDEIGEPFPE